MAFSGGVFSLYTPGNPVVTGTVITSTWANNTLSDIATGLSTAVLKDGTQTLTANIPMASYKLTGLTSGTAATDSASFGQITEVLISSQAASASTSIDFTSGLNSTYQQYRIRISSAKPATNSTTMFIRVSTDGGSTFYGNGEYSAILYGFLASGTSQTIQSTASASGFMVLPGLLNSNAAGMAEIVIDNPSNTGNSTMMRMEGSQIDASSSQARALQGAAFLQGTTSAVNAIRFIMSSGNITSGRFSLYGIKMS